jgi:hypothetical protein
LLAGGEHEVLPGAGNLMCFDLLLLRPVVALDVSGASGISV